jgi:hypothetical protein
VLTASGCAGGRAYRPPLVLMRARIVLFMTMLTTTASPAAASKVTIATIGSRDLRRAETPDGLLGRRVPMDMT